MARYNAKHAGPLRQLLNGSAAFGVSYGGGGGGGRRPESCAGLPTSHLGGAGL